MDSYHVTGKLEARIMVEVPRTDIVTWKWFEFEVDVCVEQDATDPDVGGKYQQAARAAETLTLRGYDVETSYWVSGPHVAVARAPQMIWVVCPQCDGKGAVWAISRRRPTFGGCPTCHGSGGFWHYPIVPNGAKAANDGAKAREHCAQ